MQRITLTQTGGEGSAWSIKTTAKNGILQSMWESSMIFFLGELPVGSSEQLRVEQVG